MGLFILHLNVVGDNLYQKITRKLKLELFFTLRSIRINTVLSTCEFLH